MKKQIIISMTAMIILILLVCPVVFAKQTDAEFAKDAGEVFVESEILSNDQYTHEDYVKKTRSREHLDFFSPESEVSKVTPIYKDADREEVLGYVLELEPAGYVVIAPDTEIQPVIAYSYTGKFPFEERADNALLHLVKWDMENRLEALPLMSERDLSENEDKWYETAKGPVKRERRYDDTWGPYMTTWWHQNDPYNKYVPMDLVTGKRSVVGCAATAIGQVFNYWKYPKAMSFSSADAYTTISRKIVIDTDYTKNSFLSFSQLNAKLSNIQYAGNTDEIAALCFAVGIAAKTDYTSGNSNANFSVSTLFKTKFKYESANLKYSTDSAFYNTLILNIKAAKPAVINITKTGTETDRHFVVADGYKSTGAYHLNFGYNSIDPSSSWYSLPTGMPNNYNVVYAGILDIYPPASTKTLTSLSVSGSTAVNENSSATYTAKASFSDGTSQDVTTSATWSVSPTTYAYMDSSVKGKLITKAVSSNQSVTVTASYIYSGVTKSGSYSVTIKDLDTKPNLTGYQPTGWSDKIVVSKTTGTSLDTTPICTTDTLYLDFALINNGQTAIASAFYAEIYLDGVKKTTAQWSSLDIWNSPNYRYNYIKDYSIGKLTAGTHTIKIKLDSSNAIAESNEADNEYSKTITVTNCSCAYTISPASNSFSSSGGIGSVSVTASSGCAWTAASSVSWITITSGSSGIGSGSVSYSVASNTGTSSRTGTLTIAGKTFTVIQDIQTANLFLQNETVMTTITYKATNSIRAGRQVTDTKPYGDFVIESGANVTMRAKMIYLEPGFYIKQGCKLSIINE